MALLSVLALFVCHLLTGTNAIALGVDANECEFPYTIAIYINGEIFCSGNIIKPRWILTAAHCAVAIIGKENNTRIVAGTNNKKISGQVYTINQNIIYETFNKTHYLSDDIALLKTNEIIQFNKCVRPITIRISDDVPKSRATLTGWGLDGTGAYPNKLQTRNVTIISNEECAEEYGSNITDTTICTKEARGGGSCVGDGGTAIVVEEAIYAIVSYGDYNCTAANADIYNKVVPYKTWLDNTMEALGD